MKYLENQVAALKKELQENQKEFYDKNDELIQISTKQKMAEQRLQNLAQDKDRIQNQLEEKLKEALKQNDDQQQESQNKFLMM